MSILSHRRHLYYSKLCMMCWSIQVTLIKSHILRKRKHSLFNSFVLETRYISSGITACSNKKVQLKKNRNCRCQNEKLDSLLDNRPNTAYSGDTVVHCGGLLLAHLVFYINKPVWSSNYQEEYKHADTINKSTRVSSPRHTEKASRPINTLTLLLHMFHIPKHDNYNYWLLIFLFNASFNNSEG